MVDLWVMGICVLSAMVEMEVCKGWILGNFARGGFRVTPEVVGWFGSFSMGSLAVAIGMFVFGI